MHQKTSNNDFIYFFIYFQFVREKSAQWWKMCGYLCMDDQPQLFYVHLIQSQLTCTSPPHRVNRNTQVVAVTHTHSQIHACLHKCTKRHTFAHAHSLMRNFLTFLHVPQENIDESPFKNNSRLVGSLNDLQLFQQHVIITFIMLDCTGLGHCGRGWTF